MADGTYVIETPEGFELGMPEKSNNAIFNAKKEDIGTKNRC